MKNRVLGAIPVKFLGTNINNTMYFFQYVEEQVLEKDGLHALAFSPQFILYESHKVVKIIADSGKALLLTYFITLASREEAGLFTIPLSKGDLALYKTNPTEFLRHRHLLPTLKEVELVHKLVKQ